MSSVAFTAIAALLYAAVSLSEAGNVLDGNWQQLPGLLKRVSKGDSGIWGVNTHGQIYKWGSGSWTEVAGRLAQISSGSSIWGVNSNDDIYTRRSWESRWTQVSGKLMNVAVSNKGRVWGVNRQGKIYRRTGSSWQEISGGAKQVSVGESGVWIVNGNHDIYYRSGTFGDVDTAGSGWETVSGKLQWISSGSNIVVGANKYGEIYYRRGVSSTNPTGLDWVQVSGRLMQIDVDGDQAVGVNKEYKIYLSDVSDGCDCRSVDEEGFDLDRVEYDLNGAVVSKQPARNVGKKIIRNRSSNTQTTKYTVSRTVTETSSFQHTAGAEVSVGTTFSAGVPFIAEGEISVSVTASYEYSAGTENSEEKSVQAEFACVGAPHKVTECDALMFSDQINVPYTRYWIQKEDSSCQCTDSGVFQKVTAHRLELGITERDLKKRM